MEARKEEVFAQERGPHFPPKKREGKYSTTRPRDETEVPTYTPALMHTVANRYTTVEYTFSPADKLSKHPVAPARSLEGKRRGGKEDLGARDKKVQTVNLAHYEKREKGLSKFIPRFLASSAARPPGHNCGEKRRVAGEEGPVSLR